MAEHEQRWLRRVRHILALIEALETEHELADTERTSFEVEEQDMVQTDGNRGDEN